MGGQVAGLAACGGAKGDVVYANKSSASAFREALKHAFSSHPFHVVAVNFARHLVGQAPAIGHHSPVGAYDEQTDQVLVMDVARYKYPPVWHPLERLFRAMVVEDIIPKFKNMSSPRGWWLASATPEQGAP